MRVVFVIVKIYGLVDFAPVAGCGFGAWYYEWPKSIVLRPFIRHDDACRRGVEGVLVDLVAPCVDLLHLAVTGLGAAVGCTFM